MSRVLATACSVLVVLVAAAAMALLREPAPRTSIAPVQAPNLARTEESPAGDALLTPAAPEPALERTSADGELASAAHAGGRHAQTVDPRLATTAAWLKLKFPAQFALLTPEEALQIRELDFRGVPLTDADLAMLAPLVNLEDLGLRGTEVTDDGLTQLSQLSRLRSLGLRGTKIDGRGLHALPPALEHLDLTDTRVAESGLYALRGNPTLNNVDLNRLALGDSTIDVLSTLPALRKVELDGTGLTDDGLRRLVRNPQLKRVEIRFTQTSETLVKELRAGRSDLEIVQDR